MRIKSVYPFLKSTSFLGVVLFAFSSGFPPFDDATEVDLTLHMLQHVLIVLAGVMIAYPIFMGRSRKGDGRNALAMPALAVSAIIIVLWHYPYFWDAAVLNPAVHAVEHLSFLLVGLLSGSFILFLSDSAKIGALLAAFFGHMGYALALVSPWNIQVYSLYPLSNQVVLGWVLLLSGPSLVVGIAYLIARNPDWLGTAIVTPPRQRRQTFVNRAKVPKWVALTSSAVLVLVLSGYFMYVAFAVSSRGPCCATGSVEVSIEDTPVSWRFSPQSVTVVLGTNSTVVWVSHSISFDTVTERGGAFSSGAIAPGQSYSFTFTQPGVYRYYCIYHPWMSGTVSVLR